MIEVNEKKMFSADQIESALFQLAKDIRRDCADFSNLILVGVATGGVPLARRLRSLMMHEANITDEEQGPELGILDITFYRDDIALKERAPIIKRTDIPLSLDHKHVVLVDDVLFSGRTTRAALDALVDFGRPDVIRLAVLVDRGHRELPIRADFIGFVLPTDKKDQVQVSLTELGQREDAVQLIKAA